MVSMQSPTSILTVAVAIALALSAAPSRAELIVFDNLSAGSPDGSALVSNSQWLAQSFSTTSAGFTLSGVALRLWNDSGTSGNFELQVWDARGASGRPGAQVGSAIYTGLAQALGSGYGSLLTVSGLNVTLVPDTTYYMLAAGTSLADITSFSTYPGTLSWDATSVVTSPAYGTANSGVNWISEAANQYMKVTAASAPIPEPGTWAAMAIFAGGAAYAGWRRRRGA